MIDYFLVVVFGVAAQALQSGGLTMELDPKANGKDTPLQGHITLGRIDGNPHLMNLLTKENLAMPNGGYRIYKNIIIKIQSACK